jgi:hypothetical protein
MSTIRPKPLHVQLLLESLMRTNNKSVEAQTFDELVFIKLPLVTILPYEFQTISIEMNTQRIVEPGKLMFESHLILEIIAEEGIDSIDVF